MKKLLLFISAILIVSIVSAQEIDSHKPMGRWSYNILTKRIEKSKNDKKRMKKGSRIIKRKHVSSNQVYKLSLLFNEDEYRLGFVKEAYPSITDKSNAIVICDGFEKFSHQTILWEYIQKENKKYGVEPTDIASYQEYLDMRDRKKDKQYDKPDKDKDIANNNKDENNNDVSEEVTEDMEKPEEKTNETNENKEEIVDKENSSKIVFPDASAYLGTNKGCSSYMSEKEFLAIANTAVQIESDEDKAKFCIEYADKYCFSTEQVMKIGVIIQDEAYRYIFFKTTYPKVYDKDNYLYVKQLLKTDKFINGINSIYEVPGTEKPEPVSIDIEEPQEKCVLAEEDFEKIKSEIRKESFSSTRLEVAQKLIPEYNCIASAQVKHLLTLLSLEEDKISLGVFAYEYTLDKENYNIVRDYFTSQASRDKIDEIMK